MKKFKTGICINLTSEDGSCHTVKLTSVKPTEIGTVIMSGEFVRQESINFLNEPAETYTKRFRTCLHCSALVRFLYNKRLHTAAITHATLKAFRIINKDLGVAWIPLHILRWSVIAQQFVVVDENYQFDFTHDVLPGWDVFPDIMKPEMLVEAVINTD